MVVYIDISLCSTTFYQKMASSLYGRKDDSYYYPYVEEKLILKKDSLIVFKKHFFRGHKFINDFKHVDEILKFL